MASGTRGLFLQIGGNTDNLAVAAKAGKSILADLGTDAVAKIEDIQDAFRKLGGGQAEESARAIQQTYSRTFNAIRANAQAVLAAPNANAALGIVNVTAANDAAEAAERQAAGLRLVADASARASAAQGDNNVALRTFATASAAAAVGAEEQAAGLRSQASALALVHGELIASGEASDVVVAGHNRMSTSGLILEHVARSIGDSFAAGMPPAQIFAEQLGRLGEAATLIASNSDGEGKLGAVASFLTGGWGIALTLGASLAAPLISELVKMGEAADDGVEKLKKQEQESEASTRAQAAFAQTADGVAKAITDENEALGKNVDSQITAADKALAHARALEQQEIGIRKVIVALAEQAEQEFKNAQGTNFGAAGGAGAGIATGIYASQASDAKKAVDDANAKLAQAQAAVRGAEVNEGELAAKAAVDPLVRINQEYDRMADKAKSAARGVDDLAASSSHNLTVIEQERKAALTAEREREEAQRQQKRDDRPFGRQVTVAEATQIVGTIGGRVTSGYRSHEEQEQIYADKLAGRHDGPVAKPGSSDHERGQAIDVAYGPGISIATIKEAFRAAGVALKQIIPEPGQRVFHVGFAQQGHGPDPEVAAQRKQVRDANDDRAYQGQVRSADDDIDRANAELANTTQARSAAALDRLRSDLGARDAAVQDEVTAGKLSQADANILKVKLGSAEYEEEQLEQRKAQGEIIERQAAQQQLQLAGDIALLQLQSVLATTTSKRRDIALQLLAKDEESQRVGLNAVIANPNSTPEQVKDATAKLGQIDQRHPLEVQQANRQNASPIEGAKNELTSAVGDVGEDVQKLEVSAVGHIGDAFEAAAQKALHLHGILGEIAGDFLKLAAQSLELQIFKELAPSGSSGGGGIGGFFAHILGHADGGHIQGPGTGRSDSIVARLSNGEFVVNAAATARHLPLLHALNDNSMPAFADGGVVGSIPQMRDLTPSEMRAVASGGGGAAAAVNHFHLEHAVVTQDLVDQMNAIGARAADEGASRGFQRTQEHYARQQRYGYPGG